MSGQHLHRREDLESALRYGRHKAAARRRGHRDSKEIMGHSNINTTLRYAHTNDERQPREMEKFWERSRPTGRQWP